MNNHLPLRWTLAILAVCALALFGLARCATDRCESAGGHIVGYRDYICVNDSGQVIEP